MHSQCNLIRHPWFFISIYFWFSACVNSTVDHRDTFNGLCPSHLARPRMQCAVSNSRESHGTDCVWTRNDGRRRDNICPCRMYGECGFALADAVGSDLFFHPLFNSTMKYVSFCAYIDRLWCCNGAMSSTHTTNEQWLMIWSPNNSPDSPNVSSTKASLAINCNRDYTSYI